MSAYAIKLIIADDHEIFRDGLALMLQRAEDIQIIAQAGNGKELLELVAQHQPDIVITDVKMPYLDGIAATRQIVEKYPDIKIIALSMFDEEDMIVEMLEAGAKGYLLKNADKEEILQAINTVYKDETYYCRHTSQKLASLIAKSKFNPYRKLSRVAFTDREIEIIQLICNQCTAQEIADKLFLSRRTVEGHRTKIMEKMQVKNVAGIVIYALKHNLVQNLTGFKNG